MSSPRFLFLLGGGWGSLRLHLIRPWAEIAPKLAVVLPRVLGTVTTAGEPFFDHAILRFKLIWNADSSKKTQLLVKSKYVFHIYEPNPGALESSPRFSNLRVEIELFWEIDCNVFYFYFFLQNQTKQFWIILILWVIISSFSSIRPRRLKDSYQCTQG